MNFDQFYLHEAFVLLFKEEKFKCEHQNTYQTSKLLCQVI